MSGFAEALEKKLQAQPHLFSKVVYKIDTSYFRSRFLLYLDQYELETLTLKLEDHQGFLESSKYRTRTPPSFIQHQC